MYSLSYKTLKYHILPFFEDNEDDRVRFASMIYDLLPKEKKGKWISWFYWDKEPLEEQIKFYLYLTGGQ